MAKKRTVKVKIPPPNGFKRGLKYSVCLHALLLLILSGHLPGCSRGGGDGDQERQKQDKQAKEDRKIAPKRPDVVELVLGKVPKEPEVPSYQRVAHDKDECKDFFGGIGVYFDSLSARGYVVLDAPAGYPAAKAGIGPGTKIVNGSSIRGEVGTMVDVITEAPDGTQTTLRLVRDKICLEGRTP
jgi:hypothetical protein